MMITKDDIEVIEVGESIPVDEAVAPRNSIGPKPEGEGAVEIYCTVCGQPATDGRFSGYGPSMEWWHTIAGTLDEVLPFLSSQLQWREQALLDQVLLAIGFATGWIYSYIAVRRYIREAAKPL